MQVAATTAVLKVEAARVEWMGLMAARSGLAAVRVVVEDAMAMVMVAKARVVGAVASGWVVWAEADTAMVMVLGGVVMMAGGRPRSIAGSGQFLWR